MADTKSNGSRNEGADTCTCMKELNTTELHVQLAHHTQAFTGAVGSRLSFPPLSLTRRDRNRPSSINRKHDTALSYMYMCVFSVDKWQETQNLNTTKLQLPHRTRTGGCGQLSFPSHTTHPSDLPDPIEKHSSHSQVAHLLPLLSKRPLPEP